MKVVNEFIRTYLAEYQDTGKVWNYEDGCVFLGAMRLFQNTKDPFYKDVTVRYINRYVDEAGVIERFQTDKGNIDSINTGKVLYALRDCTGDPRYQIAIDFIMSQLKKQPRCSCGNFWHKQIYPNQVWLDGIYMALPFYAQYAKETGNAEIYEDILSQLKNVHEYMYVWEKGLYCHGWAEKADIFWADSETGKSRECWLRSEGWLLMALADLYEQTEKELSPALHMYLKELLKEALDGMLQYQDEQTGLFYQVPDQKNAKGNYLETSGSAMLSYAMLQGYNLGMLDVSYQKKGIQVLESLVSRKLIKRDGMLVLADTCAVAGLGPADNLRRNGTIEYYLSEKVRDNDPKGAGALILACAAASQADGD